jgi:hypothetical protein
MNESFENPRVLHFSTNPTDDELARFKEAWSTTVGPILALRKELDKNIEERKAEARKRFPILKFFEWHHLPPELQLVSQGFADVAWEMALRDTEHPAELAAGLRKLLEAKDCAVRAALK